MTPGRRGMLVAMALVAIGVGTFQAVLAWAYVENDPYAVQYVADAHAYHEIALRWARDGLAEEGVFHQAPLFPALLALTYRVAGETTRPVGALILLGLLHSAALALLVPLGRVWFGSTRVGVLAAGVAFLHGPIAFYALKLIPVALALATQALALTAVGAARRSATPVAAAIAGAACGIAALARAELLPFVLLAAAAIVAAPAAGSFSVRRRMTLGTLVVLGAGVTLLPATAHNARHGDLVLVAASGGENLFIGNQRGAEGTYLALTPAASDIFTQRRAAIAIPERELGRALRPSEASAWWRGRALDEIAADPLGWLRLEAAKLKLILHPGDPPEIYSFALEREMFLPLLWALPLGSWSLLALAGVGLIVGWREHLRSRWPLLAFLGLHVAVLLAFFVDGRLRLPLLAFLTPFAAFALETGWSRWRSGRRAFVAAVGAAVLAATLVSAITNRPISRDRRRVAAVLSMQGRLDDSLAAMAPELAKSDADPLVLELAGFVHERRGDAAAARSHYERALASDRIEPPKKVQVLTRLAGVLEGLGDLRAAAVAHDTAVGSGIGNADTFYRRGLFRMRRGDLSGARRDLEQATRLDPAWPPPREALARLPSGGPR